MREVEDIPNWMDVQYYALFEGRGWHAVVGWTEMQDVRIACGKTYSLWDGERVTAVKSKPPAQGLCRECEAAVTKQAQMEIAL